MDFTTYQQHAKKTAIYPNQGNNLSYPVLGLCGETGEVAEKVKKIFRDKGGVLDAQAIAELEKEIGDVLWYLAALSTELGLEFAEVARKNLEKLASRQQRNVVQGSGDNR